MSQTMRMPYNKYTFERGIPPRQQKLLAILQELDVAEPRLSQLLPLTGFRSITDLREVVRGLHYRKIAFYNPKEDSVKLGART